MEAVIKYLRVDEWMSSKVTMMLGIQAYFICHDQTDALAACKELRVYFLFLSMFLRGDDRGLSLVLSSHGFSRRCTHPSLCGQ